MYLVASVRPSVRPSVKVKGWGQGHGSRSKVKVKISRSNVKQFKRETSERRTDTHTLNCCRLDKKQISHVPFCLC